jgi:hypothetical protein
MNRTSTNESFRPEVSDTNWPSPKLFGVGHFTEFSLYKITLTIAKSNGYLTLESLRKELPQRIKGLLLVESISKTAYADLISGV